MMPLLHVILISFICCMIPAHAMDRSDSLYSLAANVIINQLKQAACKPILSQQCINTIDHLCSDVQNNLCKTLLPAIHDQFFSTIKIHCPVVSGIQQQKNLYTRLFSAKKTLCNPKISVLSHDNQAGYTGMDDGIIKIWHLDNNMVEELKGHTNRIISLLLDHQTLYSSSLDGTIKIWDLGRNKCIDTLQNPTAALELFFCSSNQRLYARYLYGTTYSATLCIWDLKRKERIDLIDNSAILSLAIDDQQQILYTGTDSGIINYWDLATNKRIGQFNTNTRAVNALLLGNQILYALSTFDKKITMWNLITGRCIQKVSLNHALYPMRLAPKSNIIYFLHSSITIQSNVIHVIDPIYKQAMYFALDQFHTGPTADTISKDEDYLYCYKPDHTIYKIDLSTLNTYNTFFNQQMTLKQALLLYHLFSTYKNKEKPILSKPWLSIFHTLPENIKKLFYIND